MPDPDISDEWESYAEHYHESTPLSKRQAETWALSHFVPDTVISNVLDISKNTVERHRQEAATRIKESETLTEYTRVESTTPTLPRFGEQVSAFGTTYSSYELLQKDGSTRLHLVRRSSDDCDGVVKHVDEQYEFEDEDALVTSFTEGDHYDSFNEAVASYRAITDLVSDEFPGVDALVPEPSDVNIRQLVSQDLLSPGEAQKAFGLNHDDVTAQTTLGEIDGVPVTYPIENGSINFVVGQIGSGKSFTAKMLTRREVNRHDDAHVVFIDPLQGYEELAGDLGGESVPPEQFDSFATGPATHVDLSQKAGSDSNDVGEAMVEAVERTVDLANEDDRGVILVIDNSHYLTQTDDIDSLIDELRNLKSSFFVTQTVEELDSDDVTEQVDFCGRDGVILHRLPGISDNSVVDISAPHVDYVRTARVGDSETMSSDALVCPPSNTNWMPVEVTPEPEEIDVFG